MHRLHYIILALCLTGIFSGCTQRKSPLTEYARKSAQAQADTLLRIDRSDTLALQHGLLQAKAEQSKLLLMGDSLAAKEFDQAFEHALRSRAPELAREIFPSTEK